MSESGPPQPPTEQWPSGNAPTIALLHCAALQSATRRCMKKKKVGAKDKNKFQNPLPDARGCR